VEALARFWRITT